MDQIDRDRKLWKTEALSILLISLMNENLCFDIIFDQLSYIFTSFSKGKLHLKLWAIFADFLYVKKIKE